jgi:hypothetical protein
MVIVAPAEAEIAEMLSTDIPVVHRHHGSEPRCTAQGRWSTW